MTLVINGREVDENDPADVKRAIRSLRLTVIFIVVGFGILFFWTIERFVCERSKNMCEFQGRHIWQMEYETKERVPLSSIERAYLIENHGSKGGTTYQVELQLTDRKRPLFSGYSSGYGTHSARADKINNYLKLHQERLEIREDFWIFIVPVIFILVGSVFFIYLPHRLKKRLAELEKGKPIFPSRDP